jgi:hypothetical protein
MTEGPRRALSLVEIAARLHMKKSNVAKFLNRRGVEPDLIKAQGYLWYEEKIEAIRVEREQDTRTREADEKRRRAALRNARGGSQNGMRLGPREREVLLVLLARPRLAERDRHAALRLRRRGLVERVEGELGTYRLTDRGRELAGTLA